MTYEVVLSIGDSQIEVAYVEESYRIADVELVRGGKAVAERGRVGVVDFTVTRTTPLERSLPYTRGDDGKIVPYFGIAAVLHLVLWGFATQAHPVRERHPVAKRERPVHVAKFADGTLALPDVIREDDSEDTKDPGAGVSMNLAAGAAGAEDVASETGHITVAQLDESPRAARSEATDEARTADMLGAITTGHIKTLTGSADLTSAFDSQSTNGALYGGTGASEGSFGLGRSGFDISSDGGMRYGTIGIGRDGAWSNGVTPGRGWGGSDAGAETVPVGPLRVGLGIGIDICGKPYVDDCMFLGGLDARIIKRYVKRHFGRLAYCYEKELFEHRDLSTGPLRIDFTIGEDGEVSKVDARGISAPVATCVAEVYRNIRFPAKAMQVRHVLVYSKSHHTSSPDTVTR